MSSNRTDTRKAQISAAIKTLKETTNLQEKCKALSCIRSSAGKLGPQDIPTESQSRDICKLVINAFASGDKILTPEASSTLAVILRSYRDRKINLFNELIHINFDDRLKIFQLFEGLDDDTIKAVTQDAFIVDYIKDCLRTVNPEIMGWMAPGACTDNIKALQVMEYKNLSPAELLEEKITIAVLGLIHRLYKLSTSPNYADCAKFSPLFVDVVASLAYMGHTRQRKPAINILQLPNIASHVKTSSPNTWQNYKVMLQNTYCQRMTVLVTACESDWSTLWTISIQLLGTDLHRGAGLINNLLSVEEKAFKSVDTVVRRQAFLSWKLIVDNFALDEQELATARRVKLLCIPLNAKNSKTEAMTLTKMEVWWHLILKLYNHIEKFSDSVLAPFLNFCFGPLGDTPLLSSKYNVIASPGKRFPKTKLVAIDAFMQLLTDNKDDLKVVKSSLEDRIPAPVSHKLFQGCFKPFIHCAGEALLALAQLTHMDFEIRLQIGGILWRTLFARVKDIEDEAAKVHMYKEVMLLVIKLSEHTDNKPMLRDAMLESVLPSLDEFPANYIFQFETIEELMSVITRPAILSKVAKKHQELIKRLFWRGIKPPLAQAPYVSNALEVFKKLVGQFDLIKYSLDIVKGSSILWNVLCEMVTKYMIDGKEMNQGDAAAHDFTSVQILVKFPFTCNFASEFWQYKKIAATWKGLYKQFDLQASLTPTVKPNELVSFTVAVIQAGVQMDERCATFAVTCLDGILTTMNYKDVLDKNGFLPIVKLMNDLCILNLANWRYNYAEAALRELSSVLITLYGHAPTKVVSCLEAVQPAMEYMLKPYKEESLLREISSTWETMISIFKGLGGLLTPDLITSFREAIRLALQHEEADIVSQTLGCLETWKYMKGEAKDMVEGLLKEVDTAKSEKPRPASTETAENGQKPISKTAKLAGSFLNRRVASPRTVTPSQKPKDDRKSSFFADPDSQEYVMIKSDFKFDAKRLTEHQKESLLRRREDIPALYNDLSQSCSQDTNNIQEWFDKKKNELDKVVTRNSSNVLKAGETLPAPNPPGFIAETKEVEDSNKENKLAASSSAKENQDEPKPVDEKGKKLDPPVNENVSQNSDIDDNSESNVLVAKKLDFESRTEFPDDGAAHKSTDIPEISKHVEAMEERTKKLNKVKGESEPTHEKEAKRGVKRKAVTVSDSDSEGNTISSRVRRKIVPSGATGADVHSDSDSVKSTESEETLKQLSKRTQYEMSRLKINMVFDSKQLSALPGRRRSKINYEEIVEGGGSEELDSQETGKLTRNKVAKNAPQELMKNRPKLVEKDTKNPTALRAVKKRGRPSRNAAQDENLLEENSLNPKEMVNPVPSDQKMGKSKLKESPEAKERKEAQETTREIVEEENNAAENNTEQSESQIQCNDSEEIVGSSQVSSTGSVVLDKKYNNKQCFIRINKMKNMQPGHTVKLDDNEKNKNSKGVKTDTSPKSTAEISNEDDPMGEKPKKDAKSSNSSNTVVESKPDAPVLSVPEAKDEEATVITDANSMPPESRPSPADTSSSPVRLPTSLLNSCSPKNTLRRYLKVKSVTTQGRAAHMLGLVTKQAIAETKSASGEDDISPAKRRLKEGEEEGVAGRKERVLVLKEPERLGSPSGSRQEKIFNKMKTVPDSEAPTPTPTSSNLFGNLKNDGEKLSPGNHLDSDPKRVDEDTSPTQEREPLPMLEWSSANPPSLTASPSASILKRQRQLQVENDPESPTLASKRKRVSFADPPVSKEMGYEIPASTTPHRMSKVSGTRVLIPRKDTPVRLKQTKMKLVQSLPGKSDKDEKMETEKSMIDAEIHVLQTPAEDDVTAKIINDDSDSPVIIFPEDGNQPEEAKAAKVTIDSITSEIEIAGGSREPKRRNGKVKQKEKDVIVMKEVKSPTGKPNIDETETQQDFFDDESYSKSPKKKAISGGKNPVDDSSLRCVDINILTSNENSGLTTQSSIETLEDTVDIQNLTGLNSTSNSDEIFCSRPMRTSTQSTEADTLPVTDSVFSNLPFSQPSQTQNDTMELDQPEFLDSTRSIFPSLTESSAPIDSVISYLADPLWKPSLSSYLHSKGIETVGNLAQLTEREVNWIPVKKSPKIPFVRDVLHRFEKSMVSLPSTTSTADNSQESATTPNVSISSLPPTSTPIAQSSSLHDQAGNSVNESLRVSEKENKSTETQVSIDELLEEIDTSVVLKSAIKRCSAENIIASYKMKMRNMAEEDLVRSTIKMLGIESTNNTDAHLKSACRHSGVSKVLGRLPDIFNHDKQFFAKVLTAYRHKLAVSDCISGIDFEELKKAICQRSTSSDLAEMLSKKLKEEEEAGVTTPMTELSSLQAMLKRMPKDLIISHTVANEELISPLIVLDIALQNNNPSDISGALDGQPSSVRNRVFGDLCTIEALSTQIEKNMSDDALMEIFRAISKKLEIPKLLDIFNAVMKEKFLQQKEHEQPPPNI